MTIKIKFSEPVPVDQIIKYENGEMSQHEVICFFQDLINSGMAWRLQGAYGRQAMALVKAGLCDLADCNPEGC